MKDKIISLLTYMWVKFPKIMSVTTNPMTFEFILFTLAIVLTFYWGFDS